MHKSTVLPFIARLIGEAKNGHTADGHAYIVKLLRPYEDEVLEAYERLARSIPMELLVLPGAPTFQELGPEALETPWVVILHDEGTTMIPLSRYNPYGDR